MANDKPGTKKDEDKDKKPRKKQDPVIKWMSALDRFVEECTPDQVKFVLQYAASKEENKEVLGPLLK